MPPRRLVGRHGGRFWHVGAGLAWWREGRDLGEGFGECVADDFFAVDFESFEEGLVEEAAFGGVGLEVGGLDVVGELECEVEGHAYPLCSAAGFSVRLVISR